MIKQEKYLQIGSEQRNYENFLFSNEKFVDIDGVDNYQNDRIVLYANKKNGWHCAETKIPFGKYGVGFVSVPWA